MLGCSGEEPMSGCNIWTPFLRRSARSAFVDNCDVSAVTCNSMERTRSIEDTLIEVGRLDLDQGLLIEVLRPRKKTCTMLLPIDNACCRFFVSSSPSHHASDSTEKRK